MQPHPSGLLDDHIRAIGPRLRLALTATVTRNRSLTARQLQARAALGDAGTLDQLLTAARAGDRRWLRRIRRRVNLPLLAAVAQTLAQQELLPTDRADALAVYELIRRAAGGRALNPANQALHVQLALADEGPARARELLKGYRKIKDPALACLRADLINPFAGDGEQEPWLQAFQAMLPWPGPTVGEGEGVPFDRLASPAVERVEAAHRVSVVVTSFRPDRGLITAVRSILAQSWAKIFELYWAP